MKPYSWTEPDGSRIRLVDDIPGKSLDPDPRWALIESALDAGFDITDAINAMDALEGDNDFEPEELDGDPPHGDVLVYETCNLGREHHVDTIEVL